MLSLKIWTVELKVILEKDYNLGIVKAILKNPRIRTNNLREYFN